MAAEAADVGEYVGDGEVLIRAVDHNGVLRVMPPEGAQVAEEVRGEEVHGALEPANGGDVGAPVAAPVPAEAQPREGIAGRAGLAERGADHVVVPPPRNFVPARNPGPARPAAPPPAPPPPPPAPPLLQAQVVDSIMRRVNGAPVLRQGTHRAFIAYMDAALRGYEANHEVGILVAGRLMSDEALAAVVGSLMDDGRATWAAMRRCVEPVFGPVRRNPHGVAGQHLLEDAMGMDGQRVGETVRQFANRLVLAYAQAGIWRPEMAEDGGGIFLVLRARFVHGLADRHVQQKARDAEALNWDTLVDTASSHERPPPRATPAAPPARRAAAGDAGDGGGYDAPPADHGQGHAGHQGRGGWGAPRRGGGGGGRGGGGGGAPRRGRADGWSPRALDGEVRARREAAGQCYRCGQPRDGAHPETWRQCTRPLNLDA